jgi:hypothetical protein
MENVGKCKVASRRLAVTRLPTHCLNASWIHNRQCADKVCILRFDEERAPRHGFNSRLEANPNVSGLHPNQRRHLKPSNAKVKEYMDA